MAKANVPPVLYIERQKPVLLPEYKGTIPVVDGWNMDDPMEPKHRIRARVQKLDAIPEKGIKKKAENNPAKTKNRVSYRSARYPVIGCTIKDKNLTTPVINPTWASVSPNLSTNAGSRGEKKEE